MPFREMLNLSFYSGVCHFLDSTEGLEWREWSAAKRESALQQARDTIIFTRGHATTMLKGSKSVAEIDQHWRAMGHKTCWVRVRTDIFFDVRDRDALSEREWRVLCALYSAIGDKPMAKIGWKIIQYRAAGWLTSPPPVAMPFRPAYSRGMIERSLAELVARNLVMVATYRRGERFWTHRHDQTALWELIKERKLKRPMAMALRKQSDQRGSAAIHANLNPGAMLQHPALMKPSKAVRAALSTS